jgi:type IV pilus assembly protein PilM
VAVKTCIGLDVGSRTLRALQLSARGRSRYVITQFAKAPFNPDMPISDQIRDLLNSRSFNAPVIVTSVAGKNVFVRHHVMNAVQDVKELREHIKYEIGKFIPIQDVSELVYDCHGLEELPPNEKGEKEMRVLIAGTRRPHLDTVLSTLEAAGVIPDVVDVDACAMANAYWLQSLASPGAADMKSTVALVDLGASKVNVHIIRGFFSYFARESYKGGDDITDAISKRFALDPGQAEKMKVNPGDNLLTVLESIETVVYDLCNDIRSSIDYFEAQYEVPVDEIYITGGAANTAGLSEGLEKVCQKRVTKWRPAEIVPRELTPDAETDIRESFDQATIALGLAARLAEDEFTEDMKTRVASVPASSGDSSPMIWIPDQEQPAAEGEKPPE